MFEYSREHGMPRPIACVTSWLGRLRPLLLGSCTVADPHYVPLSDAPGDANGACAMAGGQVVFATDRTGTYEIARMLADGSSFELLTSNAWPDYQPQWSPDGNRIAWISRPAGEDKLFVMNHDGSDAHEVSVGTASDARWSPDGTRLAFTSTRDGNAEIYVVAADGSGLVNLTTNPAEDRTADWSPDGSRIVFSSSRNGAQLYVMNADGSTPAPITIRSDLNFRPRWSPDGTKIAWLAMMNLSATLWIANPDGSSADVADASGTVGLDFGWSPGGQKVAYSSHGVGSTDRDIFTVTAAGTGLTNVTNEMGATNNELPVWSPDGSRLAFWSDRDGDREVYAMSADGTAPTNLTNNAGNDDPGGWSGCP